MLGLGSRHHGRVFFPPPSSRPGFPANVLLSPPIGAVSRDAWRGVCGGGGARGAALFGALVWWWFVRAWLWGFGLPLGAGHPSSPPPWLRLSLASSLSRASPFRLPF